MEVSSEKIIVEAAGSLTSAAAATVDHKLATAGFYPPQIATASLPAFAGVEGMIVYDTTTNKLVFSTGAAWETITSA